MVNNKKTTTQAQEKNSLRVRIKKERGEISPKQKKHADEIIQNNLENLKVFKEAKTILFYVSNEEEAETKQLIKKYLSKKRIVIPVSNPNEPQLTLCHLEKWEDLQPGHFGILELPKNKHIEINHEQIDLIIVPGIAFDENGHRIGYGKGYYDSLLKDLKQTSIGMAYECQILKSIPHEPHDQPVQMILTEKRLITPQIIT
jgi:5-formyltetrahydrofolate cyclo-ligase